MSSGDLHRAANANADARTPRAGAPKAWLYFIVCQAGWMVCVMSAAHGLAWIGVLFVMATVVWHASQVPAPAQELKLVAAAVLIGAVWESVLVATGLLVYPNGVLISGTAPWWLLALWALFAVQFNVVFGWLKHRPLLAALLGALAGPLSFRAGAALGAVRFPDPMLAFAALGAGWAVLMPVMLALARRWDGVHVAD
jgi:Na+-translocating ferredoxin:NAD+ oxidoreductase RnfD subunit